MHLMVASALLGFSWCTDPKGSASREEDWLPDPARLLGDLKKEPGLR